MIKLGEKQILTVNKIVDFGVYLRDEDGETDIDNTMLRKEEGDKAEKVLLPKLQCPENIELGQKIEVFIYKDSQDRIIATTNEPTIKLGEVKPLIVKQTNKIGAFLEWNLSKDLLLPYKEQGYAVKEGDEVLVYLYIDKSDRLCASMKVYKKLLNNSNYKAGDKVKAFVYDKSDSFGYFLAVDDIYSSRIPMRECVKPLEYGQRIEARVTKVLEDGRLSLSLRDETYKQIDKDALVITELLDKNQGFLPYNDKTDPQIIKDKLHMSKSGFKRAVGRLMKNNIIRQVNNGIERIS